MTANATRLLFVALPAALAGSTSGYAVTYLTIEQAQATLCPGRTLEPFAIQLSPAQRRVIEQSAGVRVRNRDFTAWRVSDGGWFLVDQVIGKHEFITYAVAISREGRVAGLEIMDYRETYGGEVRNEKWRAQFTDKTAAGPLRLERDIKNITGATLSCRNITDGVRRLLTLHELVLKNLHP